MLCKLICQSSVHDHLIQVGGKGAILSGGEGAGAGHYYQTVAGAVPLIGRVYVLIVIGDKTGSFVKALAAA